MGEAISRPTAVAEPVDPEAAIQHYLAETDRSLAQMQTKLVRVGEYAAEVEIHLIDDDDGWSPYLSLEDAQKLDEVREALRRGDLKTASQFSRVFRLTPVSV